VQRTRRQRTIGAPAQELWEIVRDPHHLARWWPRVTRVEGVQGGGVEGGIFTEVLQTDKGKAIRADFLITEIDQAGRRLTWAQQLQGSPFARLLASAETEVWLTPEGSDTQVTIELRQSLTGILPRLGGYMVHRAAAATLDGALDGLEAIAGVPGDV
jgi:uncharacterized protein YndB with AHSA1/START domain